MLPPFVDAALTAAGGSIIVNSPKNYGLEWIEAI
jgi:hypothetical protein